MGTYTFEKQSNGQIHRFRNGEFQETVTNSEFQLLQRIAELEAHCALQAELIVKVGNIGQVVNHRQLILSNEDIEDARSITMRTPKQSLARTQREAIEKASESCWVLYGMDKVIYLEAIKEYAEQLTDNA